MLLHKASAVAFSFEGSFKVPIPSNYCLAMLICLDFGLERLNTASSETTLGVQIAQMQVSR